MAQYGEVRIDFITYTTGVAPNEANRTVTVSSLIGNPTFTGDVIVSGSLEVADDVFISGNLNASGDSTLNNLNVTGIGQIDELFVSGNATITGQTTIESGLTVEGLAYVSGLTVSGNTVVSGTLNASGDVTFESGLEVKGTSSGTSGIFPDLDSDRIRTSGLEVQTLWVSGNTNISGDASIGNSLDVSGLGTFSGITVTGDTVLDNLTVTGIGQIDELFVSGNATITGDAAISGNTDIRGDLTVTGTQYVLGDSQFAGDINVGGYDGGSTTTDGVLLGAVGGVYSQLTAATAGTGVLWQGMHGSTFTSRITANGTATFGLTSGSYVQLSQNLGVTINDGTVDLYQATTNPADKPFKVQTDIGGTKVEKVSITANGILKTNNPTYPSTVCQIQTDAKNTEAYSPTTIYNSQTIELHNSVSMGSAIIRFRSQSSNGASGLWNIGAVPRTASPGADFIFQSRNTSGNYNESIRLDPNGGIKFNGDTAAANNLDDYEEGTWTPTFEFGTWTYLTQQGIYTIVGNVCTASFLMQWSAKSGTGEMEINLPFITGGNAFDRFCISYGYLEGVDTDGNKQLIGTVNGNGSSRFAMYYLVDNSTPIITLVENASATGQIQASITYQLS